VVRENEHKTDCECPVCYNLESNLSTDRMRIIAWKRIESIQF